MTAGAGRWRQAWQLSQADSWNSQSMDLVFRPLGALGTAADPSALSGYFTTQLTLNEQQRQVCARGDACNESKRAR